MGPSDGAGIAQLIQLISVYTGLKIREQDQAALCKKVSLRMQALRLTHLEQYHRLLAEPSFQSDREWQELMVLLTTGESYLFRDQGQLSLLKQQILPELIQRRQLVQRQQGLSKPSLRIWSAGCSTGEEAYSLAILVYELLPDLENWNLTILGTDINPRAIEAAQKGIYSDWSFRTINPELQQQFFHRAGGGWELNTKIRKMVTFQTGNLVKDVFPTTGSELHDLDLILCRNVFIYFNTAAISSVSTKFYQTLRLGGYLMAGHAELHGQDLGCFQIKIFPESVLYQRGDNACLGNSTGNSNQLSHHRSSQLAALPLSSGSDSAITSVVNRSNLRSPAVKPSWMPSGRQPHVTPAAKLPPKVDNRSSLRAVPSLSPGSTPIEDIPARPTYLQQAELYFDQGDYLKAIQAAGQAMQDQFYQFDAYYLMAQASANLGQYQQAEQFCHQAIASNSLALQPYYLLARIAEEQGKTEETKSLLKRIIYLSPSEITAYLELGSLYAKECDVVRAKKMRMTALELIQKLPPHAKVDTQQELRAGELLLCVRKLLKNEA